MPRGSETCTRSTPHQNTFESFAKTTHYADSWVSPVMRNLSHVHAPSNLELMSYRIILPRSGDNSVLSSSLQNLKCACVGLLHIRRLTLRAGYIFSLNIMLSYLHPNLNEHAQSQLPALRSCDCHVGVLQLEISRINSKQVQTKQAKRPESSML